MKTTGTAMLLLLCLTIGAFGGAAASEKTTEFWLDQLPIYSVSTGWGTPHWGQSIDGNPLRIAGQEYTRGLGTHAHSELWLDLRGEAKRFTAKVGVDDEMDSADSSIEFLVRGDGKVLWRSGVMRNRDAAKAIDLDLSGVKMLVLEANGVDDNVSCDHADWIDPKLILTGKPPTPVWKEADAAIEVLKELRAFQNGQLVLDKDEVMGRLSKVERLFPKLAAMDDEPVVRPLLESIRLTCDLPSQYRENRQTDTGSGRREVRLDAFGVAAVTCGYGSPQTGKSNGGKPLTIQGREFTHGIGTHANSRMALKLFGEAERLTALVGVDDEVDSPRATIEFLIHGDGKVLWQSGVMKADDPAKKLDVGLKGVQELILEATDAGDGNASDHANWADAKLLLTGRTPQLVMPKQDPTQRFKKTSFARPLDRLALTWSNALALHTPAKKVQKAQAADYYPGKVGKSAKPVTQTVKIDLRVPFWHSTGLYALPGEPVTVKIPGSLTGKNLKALIGCHTDRLYHLSELLRAPEITRTFDLAEKKTVIASAYGGLIYILVPAAFEGKQIHSPIFWKQNSFQFVEPIVAKSKLVKVKISGAARAPRFVAGVTDVKEWREQIRDAAVPMTELEGKNFVWSVRTELLRDIDNPGEVVKFWDDTMDHIADLAGWPRERVAPMRFVLDRQISAGGGHSGYPLMAFENWSGSLDVANVRKNGTRGAFHEIGHNHQWSPGWTFQGQGEVTVNLFSLYANEKMCGQKTGIADGDDDKSWSKMATKQRHIDAMRKIFSTDPKVPGKWAEADLSERLMFHVQLVDAFGWDAIKKVIASYRHDRDPAHPESEEGRAGEYMTRLSRIVGRNLYPFFHGWGLKMPEGIETKVKDLPVWTPEILKEANQRVANAG